MAERHRLTSTTSARQAFEHVKALAALGPRIAGTARERKAAAYVAQQFKSYGLPVELQAVPGIMAWEGGEARLRVLGPGDAEELTSCPVLGSKPTPKEGIEADLVYGGRGTSADHERLDLGGKIILHDPPRARTLDNRCGVGEPQRALGTAVERGAVGVIEYARLPGNILQVPCLAGPEGTPLPAVGTTYEGGLRLKELLGQWYAVPAGIAAEGPLPVRVWMKVDAESNPGTGTNVIATLAGSDLAQEKVILLAHHDNAFGPGACDNAASVGIVLETARALAEQASPRRTVQFISVTGEEYGSVGSGYFVQSLGAAVSDVKACIVLDIVGSGNKYFYITTSIFAGRMAETAAWLNERLVDTADQLGYMLEPTILEFASDDGPFIAAGVPTSYLCRCISTSWPYLHTYMDTPDIIDYNAMKVLTDLCVFALSELAALDDLPRGMDAR